MNCEKVKNKWVLWMMELNTKEAKKKVIKRRWSAQLRSTLMAHRPMARTDLRTKSTSTSVAYSFNSARTCEMLLAFVNLRRQGQSKDKEVQWLQNHTSWQSPFLFSKLGCSTAHVLPDHDIEFLQLDVDGVVVFDEEDLHFVLEDFVPLLDDEIDVAQRHILNFRFGWK